MELYNTFCHGKCNACSFEGAMEGDRNVFKLFGEFCQHSEMRIQHALSGTSPVPSIGSDSPGSDNGWLGLVQERVESTRKLLYVYLISVILSRRVSC